MDGVHWILPNLVIPLDSTGVRLFHWILPESSGLPQQKKSGRGFCRNMLVSSGLHRTPPRINMPIWPLSHQDKPGFDSGGFHWNLGVSCREGGGVHSPPIPMPDAPTGARNVIVSSSENHDFASCRTQSHETAGLQSDKMVRTQSLCIATG